MNARATRNTRTKPSFLTVAIFLLLAVHSTGQAAGTLTRGGINGCSRGSLQYDILWSASGWTSPIRYMDSASIPSVTWTFYAGNFNYAPGSIPGKSGRKYRMMAQPAGAPYLDSNILIIPEKPCEIDP